MIILGSKGRPKVIAAGQFFCPACNGVRPYQHYQVDKYFTLYWIPLFNIGKMGEYIQCQSCQNTYPPDNINYRPPTEEEKLHVAILGELQSGIPAHMVIRKLEDRYGDHTLATRYVYNLLGSHPMQCPACQYLYHETQTRCLNCGSVLAPATRLLPM
jgi:hypothetical protein